MIYRLPAPDDAVDQGDIIGPVRLIAVSQSTFESRGEVDAEQWDAQIIVLTQTCDLFEHKTKRALVAQVFDAEKLIADGILKPADVRGNLRSGRVYGWYFLPRSDELQLPEMIVDLRQLHTVLLAMLAALCRAGQRRGRMQPLYREHLAKHFADSYSRIGLPQPYETM